MDKVIFVLERQLKKEQDRIEKKDPKSDELYVDQLEQAISTLKFFITTMNFLKG